MVSHDLINYDLMNKGDMTSVREEVEGIGKDMFKLRGEGYVTYL